MVRPLRTFGHHPGAPLGREALYQTVPYDVAIPLFHALVSFDIPNQDPATQDWFYGPVLEGYSLRMVLDDEWQSRIPAFVRFRRIELFAWMHGLLDMDNLSDWDRRAMGRIREGFDIKEPLV